MLPPVARVAAVLETPAREAHLRSARSQLPASLQENLIMGLHLRTEKKRIQRTIRVSLPRTNIDVSGWCIARSFSTCIENLVHYSGIGGGNGRRRSVLVLITKGNWGDVRRQQTLSANAGTEMETG